MTPEIKVIAEAAIELLFKKAEAYYNREFPRPTIIWDLKGTTAGWAQFFNNPNKPDILNFNAILFMENRNDFLNETFQHEIAHLISYYVYGSQLGKGHGYGWKQVMWNCFGVTPTRTHTMDVSNVVNRQKRYVYSCQCEEHHHIAGKRHSFAQRGRSYICNKCKTRIIYTGKEIEYNDIKRV
jgi:SprT protein